MLNPQEVKEVSDKLIKINAMIEQCILVVHDNGLTGCSRLAEARDICCNIGYDLLAELREKTRS